ncbi:MAG: DUF5615 family PIN-like protein [Candidatus Brocadia sp.]
MKFLLDSCISSFAVKDLRNAGFDVVWISESGKDPGDEDIIKRRRLKGTGWIIRGILKYAQDSKGIGRWIYLSCD